MACAWYFSIAVVLSASLAECSRIDAAALQTHLSASEAVQNSLHEVSSNALGYGCQFRGKDYKPEHLCNKIRSLGSDVEDCGFSRMPALSGKGCPSFCTAMRAVLQKTTSIPCESIEPALQMMSQPNPFDCSFKGNTFDIQSVCERVKGARSGDPDCGFGRAKGAIVGKDCAKLCSKVKEAIGNEPTSKCDVIAWHVHANAIRNITVVMGSKDEVSVAKPVPGGSSSTKVSDPKPPLVRNVEARPQPPQSAVPGHGSRIGCKKVWVIIEGDNSNGLNIRMGSMQYGRLMQEDLGWDASCAIVLVNPAEDDANGEFVICRRGAKCVRSSVAQFTNLPRMIVQTFPGAEKIFLMFNDHGAQESGLVFPGSLNKYLKRSFFLTTLREILTLPNVISMFVLVDACFSGSMFGDAQVQIKDAAGGNVSVRASHGGDAKSNFPDLVSMMGKEVGKDIAAFASSIPQLACMESGMRGGLFSWSYMNALDSLLARYLDEGVDFTFGDIIDSTWEQMPPLLPEDVEAMTFRYIDPATQNQRTQRQPSSLRGSSQTFFPMSYGTMSGKSAAAFFCAGLEGASSCQINNKNPLSSRCELSRAASKEACLALNRLPDEDPRGFAPLTKQCEWSGEFRVCLPWVKAHAYTDKFAGGSVKDMRVVRCAGGSCTLK